MTRPPHADRPAKVEDHYQYWNTPPPELSGRCKWWATRMLVEGWRPPRRIRVEGYDSSATYYGVYIWEYIHILARIAKEP